MWNQISEVEIVEVKGTQSRGTPLVPSTMVIGHGVYGCAKNGFLLSNPKVAAKHMLVKPCGS